MMWAKVVEETLRRKMIPRDQMLLQNALTASFYLKLGENQEHRNVEAHVHLVKDREARSRAAAGACCRRRFPSKSLFSSSRAFRNCNLSSG